MAGLETNLHDPNVLVTPSSLMLGMLLADLPGLSLNGGSSYELDSQKRKKESERGWEERRKRRHRKTERKIRVKCKREGWKGGRKERGREERKEGKKERERKKEKKEKKNRGGQGGKDVGRQEKILLLCEPYCQRIFTARTCPHFQTLSKWFSYPRSETHWSGGDSCRGWCLTHGFWYPCKFLGCVPSLFAGAQHEFSSYWSKEMYWRYSPCFINSKINSFFFFYLSMRLKLSRARQAVMTSNNSRQPGSSCPCKHLCELGCHPQGHSGMGAALNVSGHRLLKSQLWKEREAWL